MKPIKSILVCCFLLMGAISIYAQVPKSRKRVGAKSSKVASRPSVSSPQLLCAEAIVLPANAFDSVYSPNTVLVQVTVDEAGNVIAARAISGKPQLREKAVEAARQKKFVPKLLSGKPIKVTGLITYKFESPQ